MKSLSNLIKSSVWCQQYVRHTSGSTSSALNVKGFPTNSQMSSHRIKLFEQEQKRQKRLITDVNKIKVEYKDQPEPCTLFMNKMISTPFDCARHVSKKVGERAVVADIDGQLWDMHRPLENDCTLKFLHFCESDPYYANKAFWRSCTLMLGAVLESSFKKEHFVQLCSFPAPNVRTGSFVYDVDLGMDWKPTTEELKVLSHNMVKMSMKNSPFERLSVSVELAQDIFKHNVYKCAQIPLIAKADNKSDVTLYRVGEYIDLSCGPLMSNTGHMGRVSITAAHNIPSGISDKMITRVQGVALPDVILINHFNYSIVESRAKKLNEGRLPNLSFISS